MNKNPNEFRLLLILSLQDKKLFDLAAEVKKWSVNKVIRVFSRAGIFLYLKKVDNVEAAIAKALLMEKTP